jgi:hypothetical protein
MYPSTLTAKYGGEDVGVRIGGGHPIAKFPHPEHGVAANMEFAKKHGLGKTVGQLRWYHVHGNWNGSMPVAGLDTNHVITAEDLANRNFMTTYTQSTSSAEGNRKLTDKALNTGFDMYSAGSTAAYEANRAKAASGDGPKFTALKTRMTEPGQGPAVTSDLLSPDRMAPPPPATAGAGGVIDYSKMSGRRSDEGGMEQYIEYAARKSGLNVEIAHGIEKGHARHRPGSPSYDLDLYDPVTKQRLSANNPEHRAKIAQFIEESAAAGATGIGAGYVYMGGHRFHIGGGNPAVWGDGLVRAGAPKWVIDAYERGRARVITEQKRTAELQRMRDAAEKSKLAGPSPTGDTKPGIETLKTRPVEPITDINGNPLGTATGEGGDVAAGKGLASPYLGGRAAGKGLSAPYLGRTAAGKGRIDRSVIDRVGGRSIFQHRVRGRGTIDVTINKSADSRSTPIAGPFKKIRMQGKRQNERASTGAPEPTAADHDPGLDS